MILINAVVMLILVPGALVIVGLVWLWLGRRALLFMMCSNSN